MKLEVPKRFFLVLQYSLSWSNKFCGERGKRGSLAAKVKGPWQMNVVLLLLN